ncbi:MAG: hypothetical protein MRZ79_25555 [Bacteroidia bacterium]|nr:hypothetical protein [Bacteroidia bacterium]
MRSSTKSFNIRSGRCTIYRDRVEILQEDISGKIGNWLFKRNIHSAGPVYLLAALLLFIASLLSLTLTNYFLLTFLIATTVVAIYLFFQNRNYSLAPLIQRDQINQIRYHEAIPGKSRPYFEISFSPKKEEKPDLVLLRKIVLPNTRHKGTTVADTAYWILKDEGLISDRQA